LNLTMSSSKRQRRRRGEPQSGRAIGVAILMAFLLLCFIGGGGSRADVQSLLYLRPAAIICIAALLLLPAQRSWQPAKPLLLLCGLFAATMMLQLVPLPPDLWTSLPGRGRYVEAAAAIGGPQPWRPISLTPDLTLNSLLALLPPLVVMVAFASLKSSGRRQLLVALLAGASLSIILALAQLGGAKALFLYDVTHEGSGVGFFANRNHQALLLAMTFPMLRVWTLMPAQDEQFRTVRAVVAFAGACALVPAILVTGSKAGLALGLLGMIAAILIAPPQIAGMKRKHVLAATALAMVPLVLGLVVLLSGRALAIERLLNFAGNVADERRVNNMPLMLDLIREFFPVGTGFGSFDPVFRGFESDASLSPRYFNHAHNELVELALTGGVLALIVLAAFLVWYAAAAFTVFRVYRQRDERLLLGRLGAVMIIMIFASSIVEYPLRTPLLSAVFTIACCWLAIGRQRGQGA
jgi:O-antigen ligase